MSITLGLQHYCFNGLLNLYRVCGLRKLSRQFWTNLQVQNDSKHSDLKHEVFNRDNNKDFCLVQKLTMGEADFNQFMRLRNHLVNEAEKFGREENVTPVLTPTMSKDKDELLQLALKVVEVVNRANKKIRVTLLRYNVDSPESFYAQN